MRFHFAPFADPRSRSWLHQNSFVDVDRRFVYVRTLKVATTSIRLMLRALSTDAPPPFSPLEPFGATELYVHNPGQDALIPLTHFSGQRLREIVCGDGWFRFCVIRHPYDRFFSAWQKSVFLREAYISLLYPERYLPKNSCKFVEFRDFFETVVASENPLTCDAHWRAQVALLFPDDIAYTRFYDVSELSALLNDLQRHLESLGRRERVPPLERSNESFGIPSDGFLTTEVAVGLRKFYAADFGRFGFPDREAPAGPIRSVAEFVSPFTDAIFDRNRAIAEHVRWANAGILGQARRYLSSKALRSFSAWRNFIVPQFFGR